MRESSWSPTISPSTSTGGSSAEQGEDQRLDDAERAANRARVSPRFEVMRARNVPLRLGGCFVDRVPERDRVRDLRHGRGEVEIGGGIEHRIAAEDDERLDRARLHRGDERGQRAHARKRRVLRLVVADRLAGVAEMTCSGRRPRRGRRRAGVPRPRSTPCRGSPEGPWPGRRSSAGRHPGAGSRLACGSGPATKACSERREEGRDLPALETEPMIRHGSRQRVDPFNGVEPVHRAAGGSRTPSGREASRVTDHLRVGEERVGVEGENHRRSIEPEHEVEVAPRGGPQAREPVLVADGLVGRPHRTWGSGRGTRMPGAPGSARRRTRRGPQGRRHHPRHAPWTAPPRPSRNRSRTSLSPFSLTVCERSGSYRPSTDAWIRALEAPRRRRVSGVSLDLGRSSFVALDDEAVGAPAERHGRRVVAGNPGDDLLGGGDIGDNLFDRAPAPREPRERQRGAERASSSRAG